MVSDSAFHTGGGTPASAALSDPVDTGRSSDVPSVHAGYANRRTIQNISYTLELNGVGIIINPVSKSFSFARMQVSM